MSGVSERKIYCTERKSACRKEIQGLLVLFYDKHPESKIYLRARARANIYKVLEKTDAN